MSKTGKTADHKAELMLMAERLKEIKAYYALLEDQGENLSDDALSIQTASDEALQAMLQILGCSEADLLWGLF